MMALILSLFSQLLIHYQEGSGGIPDAGVRISILVIGIFLLLIGGGFIWLKMSETGERGDKYKGGDSDKRAGIKGYHDVL